MEFVHCMQDFIQCMQTEIRITLQKAQKEMYLFPVAGCKRVNAFTH